MLEWWNSVLEIPGATRIIYPSLLLVLVLVAYYVLQLFRNLAFGGGESTANHLDTFRKMRDDGMIGTDEYKKVALAKGFRHVASGPLVRSSYHAADFRPELDLIDDIEQEVAKR